MALNMTIEVSSGIATVEVPDDVAKDLQEAYDALKDLPVNRTANVDFPQEGFAYAGPAKIDGKPVTEDQKNTWCARQFAKQGKSWAASQVVTVPILDAEGNDTGKTRESALLFARKGDIKGNPNRVSFRIYVPRVKDDGTTETEIESAE